ncbi:hypothetical protein CPB83DRAFT_888289 [Crepidotus variabilis]|uniref:DUF6533 domain-containing protein n=1 Tax=Crepidotus variabilis TaxID=179855 RepID=A0A9P6ESY9_9AGAR|nr:hypothetical protein CPB83DRAFT_888289 [Crepidotus variabilis]
MPDGTTVLVITVSQLLQPEFRLSLVGLEVSKCLSIALFALLLYEYFLTVDEEKEHFWSGPYSISHYLFAFNRYFTPIIVLLNLVSAYISNCPIGSTLTELTIGFFVVNPSVQLYVRILIKKIEIDTVISCQGMIPLVFLLVIFSMSIIKAILVARVWYQFPGSMLIRLFMVFAFLLTTSVSLAFLYISLNKLEILSIQGAGMDIVGCRATRPKLFWRIYLPDLLMHTLLYALTVYDVITNPEYRENTNVRNKLLKEGGAFYFIVLLSVTLTSLGSFLTNFPVVNVPATFSPTMLVATSIATSRLMFSLRRTTREVESSVNESTFQFVPMPLTNINIISDFPPLKKVPSSRFSADSDIISKPTSVRSQNKFVLDLGSVDEEKGMANHFSSDNRSGILGGWEMVSVGDMVMRAKRWMHS